MSQSLQLEDIFDEAFVSFYCRAMDVVLSLDMLCCFLYGVLIFFYTPHSTTLFRVLGGGYMATQMVLITIGFIWKPILLGPFNIIYPVGWVFPMAGEVSRALSFIVAISLFSMIDIFLVILLIRHGKFIEAVDAYYRGWLMNATYVFVVMSNAMAVIVTVLLGTFVFTDTTTASDVLRLHVIDVEPLLSGQPVLLNISTQKGAVLAVFLVGGFYVISRGATVLWIQTRDFIILRQRSYASRATQHKFELVFKVTLIQATTICIVGGPVCLWVFFRYVLPQATANGHFWMICVIITAFYPIINFITMVIAVRPYRRQVLGIIAIIFLAVYRRIVKI